MALIKNDMPPRLLGLGLNFMLPELVVDPDERARLEKFRTAFQAAQKQPPSLLALMGVTLADTAEAVSRNVDDTHDPAVVKKFLNSRQSRASRRSGSRPKATSVPAPARSPLSDKNGHWTKADPIK